MAVLPEISGPTDLRRLNLEQLRELADEIRQFLIDHVSATGGHLGPNLGVVELTLALHRVFDSPDDPILFDTGHQSYVHKLLTGRQAAFASLRQAGGLSGYPARAESEHDWMENSHASTALSWGTGLAQGFRLRHDPNTVVVVVGDGALTGGMAWEALNNISVHPELRLVIVVNDNGRSYAPTRGGLARHLSVLRTDQRYEQFLDAIKQTVQAVPGVGGPAYDLLHGLKTGVKDILAPQGLFSDLRLKYAGPIDGHDLAALEQVLQQAKAFHGPVMVHCLTEKGRGFEAAENHQADRFHAVGRIDSTTGQPLRTASGPSWTEVFAQELTDLGAEFHDLVAISAAMVEPVGLGPFALAWPERTFDVGIAEQHAVASAAGLATAGFHPVVALYSTFLNRGFDQLLMDVGLHRLGVTFVLDRAGLTGPDGPSHHGVWDMAMASLVPGLRLAVPRDQTRLRQALRQAVACDDHPTVVRYPRGRVTDDLPPVEVRDGLDVLFQSGCDTGVLIVGYGPLAQVAVAAGRRLAGQGRSVTVVDPVWALPVKTGLVALASTAEVVISLEDGIDSGGLGQSLTAALADAGWAQPVRRLAIRAGFVPQGKRAQLLAEAGLTADQVVALAEAELVSDRSREGLADRLGQEIALPAASPQTLELAPDGSAVVTVGLPGQSA
ncbi:MAG: 1-deoxy-D-xylulose-5-phosphate synthase [Propionibacteriaceae bacterium]|jgi:1-deoxy-D-xylulose-5-phosphate synthase|nr:1-deoxy-D-xylulose-5-phosphate synthase [Propionibacteriaceae bacterium]